MNLAERIRRSIVEQSKRANVGHIGSALSIADILACLYGETMALPSAEDPERDRFILSKGHASLALYAALEATDRIDSDLLATYCAKDGTELGTHPEHIVPWIDFSTGSLGHGLPIGAGAALAARLEGSGRRTFVLVSDAECNEGSLWEAVMFAAHHRLSSLVAIVDVNGQQALGHTRDVMDLEPLEERWAAFGWSTVTIDGHDADALSDSLAPDPDRQAPLAVLAETTFGKGVSFMEGRIEWHYWPLSDEQFAVAVEELERALEGER